MNKLNFLVYLNAYADANPSNAPSRNNFKWSRELNGLSVNNPNSLEFSLAPGETKTLINGMRTLTQDNTTEYSIALAPSQTSIYQLSWVGGTNPGFRTSRTSGADATTLVNVSLNGTVLTFSSVPSTFASFTGQVAGMTTNVVITAINSGTVGNSVVLNFDGVMTLDTVIGNWNIANNSNNITYTGDGTQIPNNGTSITLSGGVSSTSFNLISGGVVVGDFVQVGSNFNALNQGQYQIIALTATSFSVVNAFGVGEGPIVLGSGFASQIDIFSAAGVQPGDTLLITGGFSPVTRGSYIVTAVTDMWVQFSYTGVLPIEGPITTEAITFYSDAQRLVYLESNQKVTMVINGQAPRHPAI